jgi:DNA-binding CsgD family transcriptional regulator
MTFSDPDSEAPAASQIEGLREALGRLREGRSLPRLFRRATAEACRSLGFDRAALFSVRGSTITLESAHLEGRTDGAGEPTRRGPEEAFPPRHPLAEVVRRRAPVMAAEGLETEGLESPLGSPNAPYVAAPIMPEGRVIGILCADRASSEEPIEERDRDALWAFAEGLGFALERVVLLERLQLQRTKVNELIGSAAAFVEDLTEGDLELASAETDPPHLPRLGTSVSLASESGIEDVLTKRELEVLELLAAGVSNGGIATRLVITQSTVKTHVKSILRKLRAENRAEAVSRYLLSLRSGRRRFVGRRREDLPLGTSQASDRAG